MSSILTTSQSVVLATAMAAVSGTVILLAFRHHKSPRSSSSSDGNKRRNKKSNNKRVHFADDVVEPSGDGVEFRKRHRKFVSSSKSNSYNSGEEDDIGGEIRESGRITGMPANRIALYNGMLRDRVDHRFGYSC